MNRFLAGGLLVVLVLGSFPLGDAGAREGDDCIHPPHLEPSYQWAYNLSTGELRAMEVTRASQPAKTPYGDQNITTFSYTEYRPDGGTAAWGKITHFSANSSFPWGIYEQKRWTPDENRTIHRHETFESPLQRDHFAQQTCPGQDWKVLTNHTVRHGPQGQQENSREERWIMEAGEWTNVTVPAGTFEVLPVTALRHDGFQIKTYWSPEVMRPALIEQGQGGPPTLTQELVSYILDRRPQPHLKITPVHPEVGDTITFNASASYDYEGSITDYQLYVDGTIYEGPIVQVNATEEKVLEIKLAITDDADRKATLSTSKYVSPKGGSGVAVDGPDRAERGQVVTLEAKPSFDPVDVRWRENSTLVGKGETYQFYMNGTRTLDVDAIHPSGRVHTTNHTVELVEAGSSEADASDERNTFPRRTAGTSSLAILEPLEGQVVPPNLDVRVRSDGSARLLVDERPVWQGTADASERVSLADELGGPLDPGRHTLVLESDSERHTVNVTVASDQGIDGAEDGPETDASSGSDTGNPVPGLPALGLAALALALARVADRRR